MQRFIFVSNFSNNSSSKCYSGAQFATFYVLSVVVFCINQILASVEYLYTILREYKGIMISNVLNKLLDWLFLRSSILQNVFSFRLCGGTSRSDNKFISNYYDSYPNSSLISTIFPASLSHPARHLTISLGFELEEIEVVTDDGYVITLHHVLNNVDSRLVEIHRQPVILFHGLLQNSESFLCGGHKSIVAHLLSAGYDCYLCNNRGNSYSRKHSTLHIDDPQFWDYSLDEMAQYDVPIAISKVIAMTGFDKLMLIGFSQGAAQICAALSMQPELNHKVELFIALSPAIRSPGLAPSFLDSIINIDSESSLYYLFGKGAIFEACLLWQRILSPKCFAAIICIALRYLFKCSCVQISSDRKSQLFQHIYSTSSVKSIIQWFHIIKHGQLCSLNTSTTLKDNSPKSFLYSTCIFLFSSIHHAILYFWRVLCSNDSSSLSLNRDRVDNDAHDRQVAFYDLSRVTCPTAAFAGAKDSMIDSSAVQSLLPHCLCVEIIPEFEHLDLIWADKADELVFPKILALMGKY